MAVPAFLSSAYRYRLVTAVTDVQSILDALATELAALSWTDEGGGTYKSPVDAVGRFFKLNLTKASTLVMKMIAYDQNGVTIATRRCNGTSGCSWVLFTGAFHFFIEAIRGTAAPEHLGAGILDLSPEAQDAHSRYVYGGGYRDDAGSAANNAFDVWAMVDNVTVTLAVRGMLTNTMITNYSPSFTLGGNMIYHPMSLFASSASATNRYAGRMYQTIMLWDYVSDSGTMVKVPIDGATLGTFCVVRGPSNFGGKVLGLRVS